MQNASPICVRYGAINPSLQAIYSPTERSSPGESNRIEWNIPFELICEIDWFYALLSRLGLLRVRAKCH